MCKQSKVHLLPKKYSLSAELSSKHIFFLSKNPGHQTNTPPPHTHNPVRQRKRDYFGTFKSFYCVLFLSLAEKQEVGWLGVGVNDWVILPPVCGCCQQSQHADFEEDFRLTC